MDGIVVRAIGYDQLIGFFRITIREGEHLVGQWRADTAHQLRIGIVLVASFVDRVTHGRKDQVVGIEQGSIGIEEKPCDLSSKKFIHVVYPLIIGICAVMYLAASNVLQRVSAA